MKVLLNVFERFVKGFSTVKDPIRKTTIREYTLVLNAAIHHFLQEKYTAKEDMTMQPTFSMRSMLTDKPKRIQLSRPFLSSMYTYQEWLESLVPCKTSEGILGNLISTIQGDHPLALGKALRDIAGIPVQESHLLCEQQQDTLARDNKGWFRVVSRRHSERQNF